MVKPIPPDRKVALCGLINLATGVGLEFGPLTRPVVRPEEGDVRYVDAMSTDELKEQFKADTTHPPDLLLPISYVWKGGPLAPIVGDQKFHYALASHVIEHVPDVIGWMNSILEVLEDGGLLGLAIPDKRYSFDFLRPTTTTAMLIDNWLRKPVRPTPLQVYDHFSQVTKVGLDELHALHQGEILPSCYERHCTDEFSLSQARKALETDEYFNIHASVFSPGSFLKNIRDIIGLGILNAEVADFYDTPNNGQEFICVLRRVENAALEARLDRQRSILGRALGLREVLY